MKGFINFEDHAPILSFDIHNHVHLKNAVASARKLNKVKDGMWLELGTATGTTAKIIMSYLPENKKLYTFDCFTGLPEEWSVHAKHDFAQEPPELDTEKAEIIVGLFEDTLPAFLENHKQKIQFLHVDCDLYSSTKTIFKYLKDRIVPGTIIVFDEVHGHIRNEPTDNNQEARAFLEYVKEENIEYQFFSYTPDGTMAACMIKNKGEKNV